MSKKIIVAHPLKQHSFHTAIALEKEGMLYKYITTTYVSKKSVTGKLLRILKGNTLKKAKSRTCKEIDNKVIQFMEIHNLIYLAMLRIPFLKRFRRWYIRKVIDSFGIKVAKFSIKNKVDAVIMYDTTALTCFRYLEKNAPNIKRILDVSMFTYKYMKKNLEEDLKKNGVVHHKEESDFLWNDKIMGERDEEINLSQYFIGASNAVKESLKYCGVNDDRIYVVPYGVEMGKFEFIPKKEIKLPLKLLFVGQVNYRKGVHHLLEVVSSMSKDMVELYLAGGIDKNIKFLDQYKKFNNIFFKGFITRDKLPQLYQECDVFVFPSLGEGYGLVVLEALSCGLPCIVSDQVGGADAISNYINGFKYKLGNNEELKQRIEWFIDNPKKIEKMSQNARESIKHLDWNNYYKNLYKITNDIINKNIV